MSTIKDAKEALLTKLETLVDATTSPSDSLIMTDVLMTLDKAGDTNTPVNPAPEYHYASRKPEYAVHWAHADNCMGQMTYDAYGNPIRDRVYWHHYGAAGPGGGNMYGTYAGDTQHDFRANHCYYNRSSHTTGSDMYANRTTANGELGNAAMNQGIRGLANTFEMTEHTNRSIEMQKCGNAELDNREYYLTYDGTTLKLKKRGLHVGQTPTSSVVAQTSVSDHYGGVSYNKTRAELAVINQKIDSGLNTNFQMKIFKGITKIDKRTNLNSYFNGKTSVTYKYNQGTAYDSADLETYRNNKICLTDDGQIYIATMSPPNNKLNISKVVRPGWTGDATATDFGIVDDGTQLLTFTNIIDKALYSTIYGTQSSANHGMRSMQSRNRKNVFFYCPYANYSNGIAMFIVDKRHRGATNAATYYQGYNWNNTSYGATVGPLHNNDIVILKAQNWEHPYNCSIIHYIQKADGSWAETDYGNQMESGGGMSATYPSLNAIMY